MSSLFLHVIKLICVPVGHIWKLDLEQRKKRDFVWNLNFSKLELCMSCSSFSQQLKISENKNIRTELQSREGSRKSSGKLLFAISRYKIIRE